MKIRYLFFVAWLFGFSEALMAQQCGGAEPQEPKPGESKAGDSKPPQSQMPSFFAGPLPFPDQAAIGVHVVIPGKDLAANSPVFVALCETTDKTPLKRLAGVVGADGKSLDFRLDDLNPGRYLVSVDMAGKTYDVPGELRATQALAPHLEELKPHNKIFFCVLARTFLVFF